MTATQADQRNIAGQLTGPKRKKRRRNTGTLFGLLMVTPALLVLVCVMLYPAYVAFESSFYRIALVTRQETFVGLGNYSKLLSSPEFWASFKRSLVWSAGAMSSQMVVGVAVALVLDKMVRGRNFIRGLVLFPYLVPAIVAVLIWRWIFSDTVGVANWLMVDFLGIIDKPIPWFHPD